VSAPWGEPGATPLRDIQEFKQAAEQAYRDSLLAQPLVIVSSRYEHALLWSRRQGLLLRNWRWAAAPDHLFGLNQGTVVVVNGHDLRQRAAWEAQLRVLAATGVTVQREVT
jgi:hypothetical protein